MQRPNLTIVLRLIIPLLAGLFAALLWLGLGRVAAAPSTSIYHVKPTASGTGDGSSWTNAATLQDAIATSVDGDEIWVSAGTYLPGLSESDSFTLTPGVAVYGGFAATETLRTERDWEANLTILSGDIDDNDTKDANGVVTSTAGINGTNSYYVVFADGTAGTTITGTTVLDGFTIMAGVGNPGAGYPNSRGGGFFCLGSGAGANCSPQLANITFSGNKGGMLNNGSSDGLSSPTLQEVTFTGNSLGGMLNYSSGNGTSSPILINVLFIDNSAGQGGAMYSGCSGISSPSLTNVTFINNTASLDGGAMFNCGIATGVSMPILNNVSFYSNTADSRGGAMFNWATIGGVSSPILIDGSFMNNSAPKGGAVYNYGDSSTSSPSFSNATFSGNSATEWGGAIYNDGQSGGESNPILTKTTFISNTAGLYGGAVFSFGMGGTSNPAFTDVKFANNSTGEDGGALYSVTISNGVSSPNLSGVTFMGNAAANDGGAMYNNATAGTISPSLVNVVFFSNTANSQGGGMYNIAAQGGAISSSLTNVTFYTNTTVTAFGADTMYSRGNPVNMFDPFGGVVDQILNNGILWEGDGGLGIINSNDSVITISHSLIEGGIAGIFSGAVDGGNNIDANPQFFAPGIGDLRLWPGSPAIDAGDGSACPSTDRNGFLRPLGSGCDMGAYEFWGLQIALTMVPTDGELSWIAPGTGCVYDIYESTTPYFSPITPTYTNITSPFTLVGKLGDDSVNYFFIVQAKCEQAAGTSSTVGEFDFSLVP